MIKLFLSTKSLEHEDIIMILKGSVWRLLKFSFAIIFKNYILKYIKINNTNVKLYISTMLLILLYFFDQVNAAFGEQPTFEL